MAEEVVTRDISSGRYHRQTLTESGSLRSEEMCNLDDAGGAEIVMLAEAEAAEPKDRCGNCFDGGGE